MTIQDARYEHLMKLADAFFYNLQIDQCEFGGIGVDCKRPFGNSDAEADILEIIGQTPDGDEWSQEQREYARLLYHDDLIPFLRRRWKDSMSVQRREGGP